jgi:hypothetical protein
VTFFKAVALANQSSSGKLVIRLLFLIFVMAGFVTTIFLMIGAKGRDRLQLGLTALTFLLLGNFLLQTYFNTRRTAARMWKASRMQPLVQGTITSQGIQFGDPGSQKFVTWEHFARIRKTPDFLTLLTADGILTILLSSYFRNAEDWNHVVELAQSKVKEAI